VKKEKSQRHGSVVKCSDNICTAEVKTLLFEHTDFLQINHCSCSQWGNVVGTAGCSRWVCIDLWIESEVKNLSRT